MIMGKTLIEILKQFENNKKNWKGTWNENAVAECFKPCAIDLLCKGYFLVNGKYIIDLGAIELYYHEEKTNGIKDHIMYHTNEHLAKAELCKKGYPYFKFGSFNLHQSGIDVTFENPDKEYRASFLIRSYRVIEKGDNETLENVEYKLNNLSEPKFDPHSTHIFDDMFPNGIIFGDNKDVKIEWKSYNKCDKNNIGLTKRINVKEYENDNGDYKTDCKGNFIKTDTEEERNWGFKINGIHEHK